MISRDATGFYGRDGIFQDIPFVIFQGKMFLTTFPGIIIIMFVVVVVLVLVVVVLVNVLVK